MERERAAMELLWRAVRRDLAPPQLTAFRATGALDVKSAISVYKNAYWIRQHEALRDQFPIVAECLGAARFRELVRRYLIAYPSRHPELEYVGQDLAAAMAAQPDADLRALARVAALEQARVESALSADADSATLAAIDIATFARASLRFVPSLRVVDLDGEALRELAVRGLAAVGACAAVVTRPRFVVQTQLVAAEELALLAFIRAGATFGEVLDRHEQDVAAVHRPVERWFRRGWIADVWVA